MRKMLRASVLLLALSGLARAGEIGYGSPAPPPPPRATQELTANGVMPNGEPVTLSGVALDLLQSLIELF